MSVRRKISAGVFIILALALGFFYVYDRVYLSTGSSNEKKIVAIEKGDNALAVGDKLSKNGIITGKFFLIFYLWKNNQLHNLVAGVYEFTPGLKIPEIAKIITGGEIVSTSIPITFPEGWTANDMANRLDSNGFSGKDFISVVNNPSEEIKNKYAFLNELKKGQTLEGYLFPDTYYFDKNASAQQIVEKILSNFDAKITVEMRNDIDKQKKSLQDVVIMASIIEREAKFPEDMKMISSVFWNRLDAGQKLQSDATLEYVLANNKAQHNAADLQNKSPYNTYQYDGLPPGPVSNPGINAINAAIDPVQSDNYFFLTDLKTGKTIFAKTYDEHVKNKAKYGL